MSLLRILPVALALALAGCLGGDDPVNPPGGSNNTTDDGDGGGGGAATIVWRNHPGDSDGPANAEAGRLASFTWQVQGAAGSITTTQVCWDDESHAAAEAAGIVAAYNQQCSDAHGSSFAADADLNRQVIAPAPGTWYARVWAEVDGAAIASEEVEWTVVEPSSTTVTIPAPAPADGGTLPVSWRVNGPAGEVTETGVVWGPNPVEDGTATGGTTTPTDPSAYPNKETAGSGTAPATFSASIDADGTVYYRAYAVVDGETVWSHEHVA